MGGRRSGWALRPDCTEPSLRTSNAKHAILRSTASRKLRPHSGFRCGKFSGHLHMPQSCPTRYEPGAGCEIPMRNEPGALLGLVFGRLAGSRRARRVDHQRFDDLHEPGAGAHPQARAPDGGRHARAETPTSRHLSDTERARPTRRMCRFCRAATVQNAAPLAVQRRDCRLQSMDKTRGTSRNVANLLILLVGRAGLEPATKGL